VGSNREEDTDAQDFERLLAALSGRTTRYARITREEPVDQDGKSDEMDQAVRRKIRLVVSD